MKKMPDPCQFSKEELEIINDSLRFMISCLDNDKAHLYQGMKLVLEKVERLLER